ncbi:ABC transporter ATP-binding protein [Geminicoccus roseus]|uniref:ABC transporter ATP-binding protein n=1 Tax=Geminicoccus roseus TaxID=404900 RepID=UPI00042689F9|nr:ABC transporter ATP-binding protein [Geminicoccus roseus]
MIPLVAFDGVTLRYGNRAGATVAVENCTLDVPEGGIMALVGPSGCGKSTLLKLAAGLIEASAGQARYRGSPICGPRGGVGMAFQNATLLPWRSVLKNVLLPLEVAASERAAYRADPAPYVERARELLRLTGLSGFADRPPYELSGGMQQRTNLCRALVHRPEMLLLDEAFGALDSFTREELWLALQELWMERRFTVMLVTHDLREAVFLADTVHVMSGRPGRIVKSRAIDLPRPRRLDHSFTPEFTDIVHELRAAVADARTEA